MDRRERMNSMLVAVRAAIQDALAGTWTAIPATVDSYDAAKMTVAAQPMIQARVRSPDGTWTNTTLPLCPDCPVIFMGTKKYLLTFPIEQGDEGLLIFSSRCIDAAWQQGGIQPQADLRMHDLSDGIFLPFHFSQIAKPGNISTDRAQLRSFDGLSYVEMQDGHIVNVVAPGGINMTGNLHVTGSIVATGIFEAAGAFTVDALGNVTFPGNLHSQADIIAGYGTGDQVGVRSHKHGGVTAGAGQTGAPVAGT